METVFVLICLCAMAASVPVVVHQGPAGVPSFILVEASSPEEAVRKARQTFDINIDVNDNNGAGYFRGYFNNGRGYGYGRFNGNSGSYGVNSGGYGGNSVGYSGNANLRGSFRGNFF